MAMRFLLDGSLSLSLSREQAMDKNIRAMSDLENLVDFIASEYKPEKIILFGSSATEMRRKGSDIDLLIIKETHKRLVDRVVELIRLIRSPVWFSISGYTPCLYPR